MGHRDLVNPSKDWNPCFALCTYKVVKYSVQGCCESSCGPRCDRYHFGPLYDLPTLKNAFVEARDKWDNCEACADIGDSLRSLKLPSSINKIVCFGLGNDIAMASFEKTSQHPAALTIKHILEDICKHEVKLMTEDPAYTYDTEAVLEDHDFIFIDGCGVGGFLEVDENTVVFCVNVGARVKEVLADLVRPAVIITQPYVAEDMDWDIPGVWNAELPDEEGIVM
ncbi:hypothetical protein F5Y19DRAFT_62223 [Xylariaceae sp. FL1651]|nr:hypothetical protein F5Y19DRAFT_62223 [Xylariaceae sp. FL1651]